MTARPSARSSPPPAIRIGDRLIGRGHPSYLVAELSANHGQSYEQAVSLVHAAHASGADAVKLQTYTADTITLKSEAALFRNKPGSLWAGRTLYDLYSEASMPWEWQPRLKAIANELGMDCFSSPFDLTAVAFLESIDVPALKIASFELVDLPLIEAAARTGRPIILSTGMATMPEIEEALATARAAGAVGVALLKCTSAYPAPPDEVNLATIGDMAARFGVPVGLSDHTLGIAVPVAAVTSGACMVEKHFTLSRSTATADAAFSLEPAEFAEMVAAIRTAERAMGRITYEPTASEESNRQFRRSLFVVRDVRQGETFSVDNVRSIRPAAGLHTRHLREILGRAAARDVEAGTPLSWDLVVEGPAAVGGETPRTKREPRWTIVARRRPSPHPTRRASPIETIQLPSDDHRMNFRA